MYSTVKYVLMNLRTLYCTITLPMYFYYSNQQIYVFFFMCVCYSTLLFYVDLCVEACACVAREKPKKDLFDVSAFPLTNRKAGRKTYKTAKTIGTTAFIC